MKETRILIWDKNFTLKNVGGPQGYLYNIHSYITNNNSHSITFISELLPSNNVLPKKSIYKWIKKITISSTLGKSIYSTIKKYRDFWSKYKLMTEIEDDLPQSVLATILNYDIIHFHTSIDLHRARNILKHFKGKVVLTSHSPQPATDEMIQYVGNGLLQLLFSHKLYQAELESWSISNYIMFPVYDAMEPYKKVKQFNNFIQQNSSKFIFCPSSIRKDYNLANVSIRHKLSIPQNAFIACYMGRHNHIKGYDELKKFGRHILNKYNDVYFVIGGNEGPLYRLQHDRWIELGWINYGNDVLTESDVFILPNEETYFDLVTLEVLRVGTPIIMSKTGGNKYFESFPSEETVGLKLYEYGNIESLEKAFIDIYDRIQRGDRQALIDSNQTLFNSYFSTEKFIENYRILMDEISIR